jgi:hypothetical protein
MITLSLCLIYYGVALIGYQLYGWFADDAWNSYSVLTAWINLFGRPDFSFPVIGPATAWFMEWPLSLVLITFGLTLLCTVAGFREHARRRLVRLRAKWFAESASAAGYQPWTITGAVREFRKDVLDREAKGRTRFN